MKKQIAPLAMIAVYYTVIYLYEFAYRNNIGGYGENLVWIKFYLSWFLHYILVFFVPLLIANYIYFSPDRVKTALRFFLWFPAYFWGVLWIYITAYSSGVSKSFQIVNPLLNLMELSYLSYYGALMFGFCIFIIIIHMTTEMKKHIRNLEIYSIACVTVFVVIAINVLAEIGEGLASQGAGS